MNSGLIALPGELAGLLVHLYDMHTPSLTVVMMVKIVHDMLEILRYCELHIDT